MNKNHLVLLNRLKSFDGLPKELLTGVYEAMNDYAALKVTEYHNREIKQVAKEGITSFFSLSWDNIILRIRKMMLGMAKKNAQIMAHSENCKVYVIRKSLVNYVLLTTRDVDANKRMKVLGKNVDAIKLHQAADYVAYPFSTIKVTRL